MDREMFVGLFSSLAAAQAAKRDLVIAAGIPAREIHIHTRAAPGNIPFIIEEYGADLRQGDALVRLYLDQSRRERVARVFERRGLSKASEEHRRIEEARTRDTAARARTTPRATDEPRPTIAASATPPRSRRMVPETEPEAAPETERDLVLQTAREELQVGKRQVTEIRTFRIRRYVVEHPVEQQVHLHDETITVERRVPNLYADNDQPFEEKEVEVTEIHEEPVVMKVVKPGDAVVVRKDAQDRVVTVRDMVRESKVEIDRSEDGDRPLPARRENRLEADTAMAGSKPLPKRRWSFFH